MALRKKHEVLEEPQDYEIERRETPRYNHRHRPRKKLSGKMSVLTLT